MSLVVWDDKTPGVSEKKEDLKIIWRSMSVVTTFEVNASANQIIY